MSASAYQFWLASVKMRLVHPDAIQCTVAPDESVLIEWHRHRFSARGVAQELNKRYEGGYLERKAAMQAAKAEASR